MQCPRSREMQLCSGHLGFQYRFVIQAMRIVLRGLMISGLGLGGECHGHGFLQSSGFPESAGGLYRNWYTGFRCVVSRIPLGVLRV